MFLLGLLPLLFIFSEFEHLSGWYFFSFFFSFLPLFWHYRINLVFLISFLTTLLSAKKKKNQNFEKKKPDVF